MQMRNLQYCHYGASRLDNFYHTNSRGGLCGREVGLPRWTGRRPTAAVRLIHELERPVPISEDETVFQRPSNRSASDLCMLRWDSDLTTTASATSSTPMSSLALFVENNDVLLRKGTYTAAMPSEETDVEEEWVKPRGASSTHQQKEERPLPPEARAGGTEDDEDNENDSDEQTRRFAPIWSGRWRPLCRSGLPSAGVLTQVTCCKGGRGEGSWWSNVVAMSSELLTQIAVREDGMSILQQRNCSGEGNELLSNLMTIDTWGEYGTVYGLSSGEVGLVDWRQDVKRGTGVALRLQVNVPPWSRGPPVSLRLRRFFRMSQSSFPIGIQACCSLENNYRVVCSFGEIKGSVVVADLRGASGGVQGRQPGKKSLRMGVEDRRMASMLCAVGTTPTSKPIVDMHRCPGVFGHIGMVDATSTSFVATLSQLEQRRRPVEEPDVLCDESHAEAHPVVSNDIEQWWGADINLRSASHQSTSRITRSNQIQGGQSRGGGTNTRTAGRGRQAARRRGPSSLAESTRDTEDRSRPYLHILPGAAPALWDDTPFVNSLDSRSDFFERPREGGRAERSSSRRPRNDSDHFQDSQFFSQSSEEDSPRFSEIGPSVAFLSSISLPPPPPLPFLVGGSSSLTSTVSSGDSRGESDTEEVRPAFSFPTRNTDSNNDNTNTNDGTHNTIGVFSLPVFPFSNGLTGSGPLIGPEGFMMPPSIPDMFLLTHFLERFSNLSSRPYRCACATPSFFSGKRIEELVVASTMPSSELSNAHRTTMGKATYFSSSSYGVGLPRCHGSKHFWVPSKNDSPTQGGLRGLFARLRPNEECYTCISSVDNVVCYHSTSGDTICVEV